MDGKNTRCDEEAWAIKEELRISKIFKLEVELELPIDQ